MGRAVETGQSRHNISPTNSSVHSSRELSRLSPTISFDLTFRRRFVPTLEVGRKIVAEPHPSSKLNADEYLKIPTLIATFTFPKSTLLYCGTYKSFYVAQNVIWVYLLYVGWISNLYLVLFKRELDFFSSVLFSSCFLALKLGAYLFLLLVRVPVSLR